MAKYYCDRCGKESEMLHEIKVPTQKSAYSFDTKPYEVCADCENEYDKIIDKLTDIRFALFEGFIRKEGEMKEMVYYDKWLNPPETLAEGEYKGFHFYVLNLGTHPCAYIDVSDTDLYGKVCENIDIECHCGLIYSSEYLLTVDKKGWFVGWDYAHYCDFVGYELEMPEDIRTNGKRWATAEIVNECKEVIDQLVIAHPNEKGGEQG